VNIDRYLHRIRYEGARTPTIATLRALHRQHLLTVPFENLDIHLGRPIAIDEDAFVRKVVEERRGGFCYELNGAFGALLRALGYNVANLSARASSADGSFGSEFDHLTLLVTIDGERWIADVGFGDSFLEPLRLDDRFDQNDPAGTFRIEQRDVDLVVCRSKTDAWSDEYLFTLGEHPLEDFAGMCRYHQTSPQSHFTRKRICSMATPDGRITLSDLRLITTTRGERVERELASEDEWRAVLRAEFAISLADGR